MEHITNEQLNASLTNHITQHAVDTAEMNKKLDKASGVWWKISLVLLIPFIGAIFAYGKLTSDVIHLQQDVMLKANKETVENQLSSISLSLEHINNKLDALQAMKTK
jgi:hypothetical protein